VPEPLQHGDLAEITAQPLLNYLLALSLRRGELDFSAAPNLNLIYRDLIDAVYERRWGQGRHPTQKQLTREEFDNLLDELGLAAWHGAGRTVTETQVQEACERAGLQEQLAAFQEGVRTGAISLLAAFYFRQAGKIEGERTFEFTHKSFGEYLTARRIVRWLDDTNAQREENRENRRRGWTEEHALVQWVELAGPSALDSDLGAFLQREVALRDRELVTRWRKTFSELFDDQLTHRLPMHTLQVTYREMTRQARNAEEALLVAHFCCASAVRESSPIRWSSEVALRDLLARLDQDRVKSLARLCLGWLGATEGSPPQLLDSADLSGADLEGADLSRATLDRVNLMSANLAGVNLSGARGGGMADLRQAKLSGANLTSISFLGMHLERGDLSEADLRNAFLRGAQLRGADLTKANLEGTDLLGADLRESDLRGANLKTLGQDLRSAQLEKAIIERKWVKRLELDAESLGLIVVDDLDSD
jgi:Pentapeptide repeats (8 copies)